ncbi:MAG: isocitrate lyase/phosphoenolpyruvate mutase family protein [Planctomycetota bacterium]
MTPEPVAEFRRLHESGCFVLPNPWDRGSAKVLASLGFKALATSSAAVCFMLGRPETPTALTVGETLHNVREIAGATELPVNADFQAGYAAGFDQLAENVRRCVEVGAAGLSIEDQATDPNGFLFDITEAADRVRAARAAIDAAGSNAVLTARTECFLVGDPNPMKTAMDRLARFAEAGADCLFAPGVSTPEDVKTLVEHVAPLPINVLAVDPSWMSLKSLGDLGVRRISTGSALARVAWGAFRFAATEIAEDDSLSSLASAEPFERLNELFAG